MAGVGNQDVTIHFGNDYTSRAPLHRLARDTGRSINAVLADIREAERLGYLVRRPDGDGWDAALPEDAKAVTS